MIQILYGVGRSVLRQFDDPTKIVGLAKLNNVTIESAGNEDKIFADDNPYPLAVFPQDKTITISAESAVFNTSMFQVSQGGTIVTGVKDMTEILLVNVALEDGMGVVPIAPPKEGSTIKTGSVVVEDHVSVESEIEVDEAGKFYFDPVENVVYLHESEAYSDINLIFEWESSDQAQTLEIMRDTFSAPFRFIHRIPIYDDGNQVVGHGQLTIFRAKANNNFTFNLQHQTAFAPTLELEALDPKRADGKLWEWTVEPA